MKRKNQIKNNQVLKVSKSEQNSCGRKQIIREKRTDNIDRKSEMLNQSGKEFPLTIPEAARIAGVGRATIIKWIDQGLLPCQLYPGSGERPIRRILRNDFDIFMRKYHIPEENDESKDFGSFKYGKVTLKNNH